MDQKEINLEEYVDQRRWLMNNGIISDDIKNQLFLYGSIVHKEVQAVEVKVESEKKVINYTIYVDKGLLDKIVQYEVLSKSDSLFGLWRFKRMLKKEGSLDFQQVLNSFVKDFCGPKWSVAVNTIDFEKYVEDLGEYSGTDDAGRPPDQQLN